MLIDPLHGLRIAWHAFRSRDHPLLAHLVVPRRCNLACGYCNEYDAYSPPVPLAALQGRIRHLARLRTLMVACSGGEPLLHPRIDDVIREIRRQGMVAMMTTNGYLLTARLVARLNAAGLQALQISIDNVVPDSTSAKSLVALDRKLRLLAEAATFKVNINSVLSPDAARPEDVVAVARKAREYGFSHSCGIAHDGGGGARPVPGAQRAVYLTVRAAARSQLHALNSRLFQDRVLAGRRDPWHCRAGARYLYICENGLVHWCSQRRGCPSIPLERFGLAEIRQSFSTRKACSPACTVTCVRQVSMFDNWRGGQWREDPGQKQEPETREAARLR
jgi:MoaA/NifB/PqqE/SkfB family radical SAM enzyme